MNAASSFSSQGALIPTRQVLLIEDEALFARSVGRRLEKAGFAVGHASSLREGLDLAAVMQPDLILLDLRLPDGDGLSVLPQISRDREGAPVPVIVLTAFGEVEDAVSAMKQGAADYLKKPIDLDELLLVVEGALTSAGLRDRLDFSRERDSRVSALQGRDARTQRRKGAGPVPIEN